MNDLKKNKSYAVANGPVNRRTAAASPAAKLPVAQAVRQRISLAQAKRRLGTPLSHRLSASGDPAACAKRTSSVAIVQVIAGTVAATGMGLGALQGSMLLLLASVATLGGVVVWAVVSQRSRSTESTPADKVLVNLVDPADVARLDALMEKLSVEAPPATVDLLTQLKASIVRCVALVGAGAAPGSMASEESLYLGEAVRRYIPDSINSCLQVPLKDRSSLVLDGSKPALELLHDQLQMIQSQLDAREEKLTQAAGEALLRQQRFLAAKAKGT